MESATSIKFTSTASGTLTLVFNSGFNGSVKVDGSSKTISNGVLSMSLSAGSHTITKGDTTNLYYISLSGSNGGSSSSSSSTSSSSSSSSSSTASGDITLSPGDDLQAAINSIAAGKTIWLNSGTYRISSTITIAENNNGSSGKLKRIVAKSGRPVIDFSAQSFNSSNRGFMVGGDYWHFEGFKIQGAGDNGMMLGGNNCVVKNMHFFNNRDTGLQLSRFNSSYSSISQWPSNNLIEDCISQDNMDTDNGEDADGYAPKLTCGTGNIFRNCKALYNSDDGWDLYTKSDTGAIGVVKFYNCEASNNGALSNGNSMASGDGNGFKLGDDTASVRHELYDCVANNNKKHGYTGNGNPAKFIMQNCTGSGNGGKLFDRITS